MFSKRVLRFTSATVLGILAAKYGVEHIVTLKPFITDRNETIFHKICFPKVHAINKEFIDELGRLKNDISLCIEREHLNPDHKYLDYLDHFIVYDTKKCVALYSFEHLTPNRFVAKPSMRMNLERAEPKAEPRLDEEFRVEPDEFDIRGKRGNKDCFVRGFMAAEGNHKEDYAYYNSTYFMPNLVPQVPKFNAQAWNHIEDYVRFLTFKYQDVYVITGSLWEYPAETKKVIKKTKIGKEGRIEVPTHYFKIIIVKERVTCDEVYHLYSYRLPNDKINVDKSKPYEECFAPYLYPVTDIEKSLGYSFFIVSPALIFHNIYPPVQVRPLPPCDLFKPYECPPAPCCVPPYVKPEPKTPEDPLPPPPETSVPNMDPEDDPTEPDDDEFDEPLGDDRYHHDDSDIPLDLDPHDYEDQDFDDVYEFCDGGDNLPDDEPHGGTCSKDDGGACPLYMPPPCPPCPPRKSKKKCRDEDHSEDQRKKPTKKGGEDDHSEDQRKRPTKKEREEDHGEVQRKQPLFTKKDREEDKRKQPLFTKKGREDDHKEDRDITVPKSKSQGLESDPDPNKKPDPPKKRDPKEIAKDVKGNEKCKASKPPSDLPTPESKPTLDPNMKKSSQSSTPSPSKNTNSVETKVEPKKSSEVQPQKATKEEPKKPTKVVPKKPKEPPGVIIFARSPYSLPSSIEGYCPPPPPPRFETPEVEEEPLPSSIPENIIGCPPPTPPSCPKKPQGPPPPPPSCSKTPEGPPPPSSISEVVRRAASVQIPTGPSLKKNKGPPPPPSCSKTPKGPPPPPPPPPPPSCSKTPEGPPPPSPISEIVRRAASVQIPTGPSLPISELLDTGAPCCEPSYSKPSVPTPLSELFTCPPSSYDDASINSASSSDNGSTICGLSPSSYSIFGGATPDYSANSSPSARYTSPSCGCGGDSSNNDSGIIASLPFPESFRPPSCASCPDPYACPVAPPSSIPGNPGQQYPSLF